MPTTKEKKFNSADTKRQETRVNTGSVYDTIERGRDRGNQQATASKEEQEKRAAELKTKGRKGCKAERFNLAITPDNHRYIKVMSTVTGMTMTEFTNFVIEQYRKEHDELFDKATDVYNELMKGKDNA